jgi:hypothetical protein
MSRRLPILEEEREEPTLLTSIVAAQKEKELPFKLTTRRKNVIEEEFPQTSGQSSTSSVVMPRTRSREEAYEMPVETERQRSDTRLAQTMDIMGLGGGF